MENRDIMHILHLEDDSPLREVLKFVLTTSEPTLAMHQFISSDDAMTFIEANKDEIDLFILDIRVPGSMDGLGVAEKIREIGCEGDIVMTSAFRRPNPATMTTLNCRWMPKPWHIMDATQELLPLARKHYEARQQPAS